MRHMIHSFAFRRHKSIIQQYSEYCSSPLEGNSSTKEDTLQSLQAWPRCSFAAHILHSRLFVTFPHDFFQQHKVEDIVPMSFNVVF